MNKDKYLKRKLLKEGVILGVVCSALGLLAFGVGWYGDVVNGNRDKLQSEKGALMSQMQTLQTQYNRAKVSLDLYKTINRRNPKDGLLNRDEATRILTELRDRYLTKLDVAISPQQDLNDSRFKNDSVSVVSCEIKLGYEAMTDENVFRFMSALRDEFPGYINITHFNIERTAKVDKPIEDAFNNGQVPPLVKGDIQLYWLGFKLIAPASSVGAAADSHGT